MKRILFITFALLLSVSVFPQKKVIRLSGSSASFADTVKVIEISSRTTHDSIANMKAGKFWITDPPFNAISDDGVNDSTAINAAIRAANTWGSSWGEDGEVIIPPGIWNLSGPIKCKEHTSINISGGAVFYVPSGYTGNAIEITDLTNDRDFKIYGGYARILELAPAQYKWTGINISKTTSDGSIATNISISDLVIQRCNIGMNFTASGGGWINGMNYDNIKISDFKTAIKLNEGSGSEIRGNNFNRIQFQTGDSTSICVDNTTGASDNNFTNCIFWDITASDKPNPKISVEKSQTRSNYIGCVILPYPETPYSEMTNYSRQKKVVSETITFSQDGVADTIAFLDNLTIVWNVYVRIGTNFNDSGTDYLEVGYAGDADYYVNDLDLATGAGAFSTLTLAHGVPKMIWNDNYIIVTYNGQNSNATTGSVTVWIEYSTN